jgi:hypothetical protein
MGLSHAVERRREVVRVMVHDIFVGRFSGDLILALSKTFHCSAECIQSDIRTIEQSRGIRVLAKAVSVADPSPGKRERLSRPASPEAPHIGP